MIAVQIIIESMTGCHVTVTRLRKSAFDRNKNEEMKQIRNQIGLTTGKVSLFGTLVMIFPAEFLLSRDHSLFDARVMTFVPSFSVQACSFLYCNSVI